MSVLFIALPIALILGAAAMAACIYCIRGGQYDDLDTPAVRILVDDVPETDVGDDLADSAVHIRPPVADPVLSSDGSKCAAPRIHGEAALGDEGVARPSDQPFRGD